MTDLTLDHDQAIVARTFAGDEPIYRHADAGVQTGAPLAAAAGAPSDDGLGPDDPSAPGKTAAVAHYQDANGDWHYSGDADTDGVLLGVKWNLTEITFSFPTDNSQYPDPYDVGQSTYLIGLNAAQQNAARHAFELIESYTNLAFREITEGQYGEHATIRIAQTRDLADVPTAEGHFPNTTPDAGDIWFGRNLQPYYDTPAQGNWGWATFMHEIGHTMGLKHGQEDDSGFDIGQYFDLGESYGGMKAMPDAHNYQAYSLMSYRITPGSGADDFGGDFYNQPQTYMQADISALQFMYGANYETNSGATTYTWSETTGEMFINGVGQGKPNGNVILSTLWDGGGLDTYDLQNYDDGVSVDLRPGAFSTFDVDQLANHQAPLGTTFLAPGNVANAKLYMGNTASLIENAIGGDGNDVMIGNQANNSLVGGMGDDFLQGDQGNDTLDGGAGNNTASFQNNTGGVNITLNNGSADIVVANDGYTDVLRKIENIVGGQGDDNLTGDDAANVLDGGALGHDTIHGGAGDDRLLGSGFKTVASDVPDLTKAQSQVINDRPSALVLNHTDFDTAPNPEVESATTLPHATIHATAAGGGLEYYAFTVAAGETAIFDIDTAANAGLDSWIELVNSAGTKLANNDTGSSGDPGGHGNDDALLKFTFATAGTYYLRVGQWTSSAGANALPLTAGQQYTLHVSLSGGDRSTISVTETGSAELYGESGNDFLLATAGDDVLSGGSDNDTVSYGQVIDGVTVSLANQDAAQNTGGAGTDTLSGIENLTGGKGADNLAGDDNANVIDGGETGADTLNGAGGVDTVTFASAAAGVAASLLAGSSSEGDVISNFENISGSSFNDTLTGSAGLNSIVGGDGDDLLNGGGAAGGVDTIVGGAGIDVASFAGYANDITADLSGGDDDVSGDTVAVFFGVEGLEGGSGNDNLLGSNAANKLLGGDGNDVLLGRNGADTLSGGLGDDKITGGGGVDTVDVSGPTGITLDLSVTAAQNTGQGVDTVTGVENVITGSGNDSITGTNGANTFVEGGGNDTFNGGGGIDTLDFSTRTAAASVNLANLAGQNTGSGTDTISGIENLIGTTLNDTFLGDVAAATANRFIGDAGVDSMVGGGGDDYLEGGAGSDLLVGDTNGSFAGLSGNDTLIGGDGVDLIVMGAGNDLVDAGAGDDAVYAMNTLTRTGDTVSQSGSAGFLFDGGNDTIDGGEGDDFIALAYVGRTGGVHIDISNSEQVNDITVGGVKVGELISVEQFRVRGGVDGDSITGNENQDYLFGHEGDDTLNGGIGDDQLDAGVGNDRIIGGEGNNDLLLFGGFSGVTVDLSVTTAQNTGAGMDTITGMEDVTGTAGTDTIAGNGEINQFIDAAGGNDNLSGAGGNDILTVTRSGTLLASNVSLNGGDGDDLLTVTSTLRTVSAAAQTETVTANGGNGNDTILVTGTGLLSAAINAGAGADNVTVALTAAAGRGNYDLTLGQGADIVTLSGTGTVASTTARTSVIQDFQAKDGGDRFELTSYTNGSAFTGHVATANPFGDGHLRLVQSGTSLLLQADRDGVGATNSFTTIMELKNGVSKGFTAFNFDGWVVNNLTLTGTDGADVLAGSDGNDTLLGGLDRDFLEGGKGDDSFNGGDAKDTVSYEYATTGVTVDLSLAGAQATGWGSDSFVDVEHLLGSAFNDTLSGGVGFNSIDGALGDDRIFGADGEDRLAGGEGADTLDGGADNDRIDGGAGIDTLSFASFAAGVSADLGAGTTGGAAGSDILVKLENILGGDGNDTLTGSSGANKIEGGAFNDLLSGMNGDDQLFGGSGLDTLAGGRGADQLTGGAGNDRFVFDDGDKIVDTILDLESTDIIDVTGVDSNGNKPGNPGFTLVSEFHHVRGELVVSYDGANTHVLMDTNGDGVADRTINIAGDHHDFTNFDGLAV